ncbi:MAG TPA: 4-phosphoerythronate dehydrogenase [Verrucomicrobia bacterium]|nr:4-phosphoerythronate dehydrogenase [Verrucomicrobiota bacterium]
MRKAYATSQRVSTAGDFFEGIFRLAESVKGVHNSGVKIVCASSVLFAREAFGTLGETVVVPDAAISPSDLKDADALIVRSKTLVNERLIENTRLSFVGTATAGTDHFDVDYLNHIPLAWCAAPGCNANSVAEYFATAALCLAHRKGFELAGKKVGVIGVGQVGSRVVQKAEFLGMTALRNDPPLQLATGDPLFLPLEQVLAEADLLTLHVPLENGGRHPTNQMANCKFFAGVKPGCFFVNASRGEVVETDSLLYALEHGAVRYSVLDVWENEPVISRALLNKTELGTPHIAGYSFEGRLNGTLAVYRELCHFLEVEPVWKPEEQLFPKAPEIKLDAQGLSDETALWEIVRQAYDIEKDDAALRQGPTDSDAAWGMHFNSLRRNYASRREFSAIRIQLRHAGTELLEKTAALGFQIAAF